MKKRKSLIKRVEDAERRERDAKRRMMDMQQRMIHADLMFQGTLVYLFAVVNQVGPVVHISAEDVKKAKTSGYKYKRLPDGSIDIIEEGYFEKFNGD